MKRAAFFDLDGTLTTTNVWRGFLDYFKEYRLRRSTHRLFTALHYPQYWLKSLGMINESTFRKNWSAHLAWYVRGYSPQKAMAVWEWVVKEFLPGNWRMDVKETLSRHQENGDEVILVSAGPEPLLTEIAKSIGVKHAIGTRFEVKDGQYSGRSLQPVCIDEFKASLSLAYLEQKKITVDLAQSSAYADSITDLSLLEMVGYPAAVYPDRELLQLAQQRSWKIIT